MSQLDLLIFGNLNSECSFEDFLKNINLLMKAQIRKKNYKLYLEKTSISLKMNYNFVCIHFFPIY